MDKKITCDFEMCPHCNKDGNCTKLQYEGKQVVCEIGIALDKLFN